MSPGKGILRPLNIGMTIIFLLCAAVQYNDPDPLQWMTIYGVAAGACVLALRGRLSVLAAALIAAVALTWAAALAPGVAGRSNVALLAEEGRETLGLLIVGLWMIVLVIAIRKPQGREHAKKPAER
jgi:drug/metabolite transporter (DMT)-like permease